MFSMNGAETVEPADQRSKAIILLSQLILSTTGRVPMPFLVSSVVDTIAEYVHTKQQCACSPPEEPAKAYAGKVSK